MADFKLNAQVNLVSPSAANLKTVSESIRKGLGKSANIKLKISGKGLKELNTNLANLNKSITSTQAKITKLGSSYTKVATQSQSLAKAQQQVAASAKNSAKGIQSASNSLQGFGKNIVKTIKNAAAFSLVAGPIFGVQRALTNAAKEAALFQKEITKISQVTGQSAAELGSLANTIDRLSVSLGINAKELAQTARVIAQTGRSGKELELILRGLAQSTLAASFGDIASTTEGLIAILGQFNLSGKDTEAILGSINQVSKQFAVESDDLVQAVRRTGAVFNASAGGTKNSIEALQAFNAIFTSVRANTRESSETIAAGLKTIFARLQRRDTIDFLRDFGIELVATADDAKLLGVAVGDFVGQEEAFRRLSKGLADTNNAITRSAIVEEIGGIRQIGKLIPAIENFADAEAAIAAGAKGAAKGLQEDVDKALQTVAQRVEVVQATFNKFVKDIFESDAFQKFAKNVISSTEQLIKTFGTLFDALEPLLPLLSALGTFKIAGSVLALGKSAAPVAAGAASAAAGAVSAAKTGAAGATTTADTQILRSIDTNILAIRNRLVGPGAGGVTGSTGVAGGVAGAPAPGSAGFIGPLPATKTSQAVKGLGKAALSAGKVAKDLATRGFPTFGNALKRSSTVVGNAFGKLSRSLKSTGASLGATGGVATQAALGLSIFAATTLDADSALGQFANQAIGVIVAISLLGPAIQSAVAQIAAAAAAAQAGTLTAAGALGPAAFIVAAPIIGGIIGSIVADKLVDAIFPPLEELGSAAGIRDRSIEDAIRQGRQKRQIEGAGIGLGVGGGLGAVIGALAGSLLFGVGAVPGAIIGGAIGGAGGAAGGAGIGSFGGGQAEAQQQRLFDANLRLKNSADALSGALDRLRKETDAVKLKEFNDQLNSFLSQQSAQIRGLAFERQIQPIDFTQTRKLLGLDAPEGFDQEQFEKLLAFNFADQEIFNRLFSSGTLQDSASADKFLERVFEGRSIPGTIFQGFQDQGFSDLTGDDRAAIIGVINSQIAESLRDVVDDEIVGDLRQLGSAFQIGLDQSFQKIDLSSLDLTDTNFDKFSEAVGRAADSGSEFAQQLQRLEAEISVVDFTADIQDILKTARFDEKGRAESVQVAGSVTGGLAPTTLSGASAESFISGLGLVREQIFRSRPELLEEGNEEALRKELEKIANVVTTSLTAAGRPQEEIQATKNLLVLVAQESVANIKRQKESAFNLAAAAEAARRASEGLDSFTEALRDIVGAVERAANDVEVAGDNFRRTQQSLSGRGDLQSVRLNTGIGLRQGADLRSTQFSNFQIGTGVDTQNIRNFNNAISSFSDIARSSAQSLRQEGGEVSSTTVVNRLVQDFESEIGQKLPAALNDSLRNAIIGVSRQNTEGGIVNLQSFEEAIRQGALENISDEVFQELNDTTEKLIEQFQKLSDNIIEAANAEAQLNKARRDAALEITQREQRGQEDRDRLFGRQPQTFGQAEQNLEQQLGAILGETQKNNDLTGQGLLQRRAELQEQLRSARESTQTQGAERPQEVIDNIANLQTELQATTEALDLLSSETSRLNALRAEANKLLAQREQAQQITRGFLDEAVQNGFTVTAEDLEKKLDFIAAGTGGGSLKGATADTEAIANLSNEELVGSVEALNSGLSSQIARLQLGDEAFAKLQLELDKETAKRIFESLPEDSRTAEAFDQIAQALEAERELENIEQQMLQVQEDQLDILRTLAGQDIIQAEIDLEVFRNAISKQAEVIQQEVEKLNTLLKPLGEGPTGASGDPIFVTFAGKSPLDRAVTGDFQERVPLDTKSSEFSQAVADEVTRNLTELQFQRDQIAFVDALRDSPNPPPNGGGPIAANAPTNPNQKPLVLGPNDVVFVEMDSDTPGRPTVPSEAAMDAATPGEVPSTPRRRRPRRTVDDVPQTDSSAVPPQPPVPPLPPPPPPPPRPPEATPGTLGELFQDVKDTVNDIGEITPFPNGTQPVDPSLVPGSDGAAAGQIAPGEVQKAAEANTQSAVALNSAAQSLSTATTETSTALANATKDFKSAAQAWDGVSIPENVDVSISPVNVVGTDQFAQALEPTLTRIVENSVVKVLEMALQDQYNGPQVGPGFDPNMA